MTVVDVLLLLDDVVELVAAGDVRAYDAGLANRCHGQVHRLAEALQRRADEVRVLALMMFAMGR